MGAVQKWCARLRRRTRNATFPRTTRLRKVYLFAEVLGGYEALNDLSSKYSPRNMLSQRCRKKAKVAVLEPHEVQIVEDYHRQLGDSLKSANR